MPKLLIAASGTGGHLFPALAVAQALPDWPIEWLGVPERLENQLVPQATYPLHRVRLSGLPGGLNGRTLKVLAELLVATWQVRRLLQSGGFDRVFTTGGYIAAPAILAARSLGIPVVLHESNALPGKVTRWLGRWCAVVALGFAAAQVHLPKLKTLVVGTPVRPDFQQILATAGNEIPHTAFVLLITGGSQGAVSLNRVVRACVPAWLERGWWVVHQTGDQDPECGKFSHPQYIERAFFPDMAAWMGRANLVIARAGAGTLSELTLLHKPAILIPYPWAAENHQQYNADIFARQGAAVVMPQADLTAAVLDTLLTELAAHPERLAQMGQAMSALAVPDSAQRVAGVLTQLQVKL
ncbi:N-acetylglucosaminyltransferase, MurG [Gloeomargarita lithophora Alchichica-D10]|uniref:UDP-N-acetylglucosamine--N-acetylmuramyl-(pentapeptide) pyrophosphoryl-undecaprenol N-acetylglucosamine transferase n=1 Tax=Gloeomargarita lithophora Alchichica-D10 TaxID=1188229 RepID=A0A1J0AFB3_9CYAN|nr:undecaprenyldiphospho-muramoylpentapeptide beta-N-acetylglucosaminyltransferase [Gloeomargarita lithophora]APB34626.1 N-acetylglucosaminyltransferase, MurG [Gloeomargarita lithophora Alchichica-D10]